MAAEGSRFLRGARNRQRGDQLKVRRERAELTIGSLLMESQSHPERAVVVLGDTPYLSEVSERVRRLGHRIIRVRTFSAAIAIAETRNLRFSAALLDPEISNTQLGRMLNELRRRSLSPNLVCLAAGERPRDLACARLRGAGLELALWDPISDHDLRFQMNRAVSGWSHDQLRGESRAPTDWATRVFSRGREKFARIYTFSGSGAFLATHRPSLEGADLTLELRLPSGPVHVAGRVVYTNVPGNRQRDRLPNGMAVEFEDTPPDIEHAIRASVDARASDLAV